MLHSSSSSTISTTSLGLLVASVGVGLPLFVAAAEITTDDLLAKISPTAAQPGFNVEGGSVFTNLANALNHEQFFFIYTATLAYEKPESDPVRGSGLTWCSDLTFSDVNNSSLMGYAGRCVAKLLAGYDATVAAGAEVLSDYSEGEWRSTLGISAVYVEQLNVFEGQFHADIDDWVARYWDDGRKTVPEIAWEGHDEGDMNPNAATSSWSSFGELTWMSVDEVAQLFNMSVDEFTPEKFKQVYLDTWIEAHEKEAAEKNPNPLPELEIIEQVKNETNYVDETAPTAPVQSGSTATEDGGGSGRKLVSVAARIVSTTLRVFGI